MKKTLWIFGLWAIATVFILFQVEEVRGSRVPQQEGIQEGQAIEEQEIEGILETHLQKMINDRRKRVEVKDVRGCERLVLPAGTLSYEVVAPDQALRGGNVSMVIHFLVNGREVKKARMTAQVNIFADVVVARSYLKKHHVIRERDVQLANKNISGLAPDAVTEFEEVVGKRTTLTINSQEVFRKSMVERTPLVKKGDRLTLVIENDRFRITTLGEVREEGAKGDRVRLLNISSKREVYGRILDANTAKVDY